MAGGREDQNVVSASCLNPESHFPMTQSKTLDTGSDGMEDRATARKEMHSLFSGELRKWWSFDDRQQHTHSWHSREDFIADKLWQLLDAAMKAGGVPMTSPTTNTVTDDDLRDILAEENLWRWPGLTKADLLANMAVVGDIGFTSGLYPLRTILAAMRRAAALSTHPHTGTEDRATAREVIPAGMMLVPAHANAVWIEFLDGYYIRKREMTPGGMKLAETIEAVLDAARCTLAALSPAQRSSNPHTGGREAVIEECARPLDELVEKCLREVRELPPGDERTEAGHRASAFMFVRRIIRALASPPLQKTQKEDNSDD